jgi:hypothetical protein
LATDWVEKVNSTAREHVSEPVQAAGILQPAGTWGSFGLDQVSGVAAMFKQKGRSGWKIQEQLGVWNRSDLNVETTPGRLSTKVALDHVPTGEHYELEATTVSTANVNEPFLAAL